MTASSILPPVLCYVLLAAVCSFLIRNWLTVPPERRGPRFGISRALNLAVIALAGLASAALIARDVIAGELSPVGWPILLLLMGLSGFPRGAALRQPQG